MLKQDITFEDFDGNKRTETVYFNLTKSEIIELEVREADTGGFANRLKRISESTSGKEIMETFQEILQLTYGVRSDDGTRFIKHPNLYNEFKQTAAYDAFFQELVTDAEKASDFVNGVLPASLVQAAQAEIANNGRPPVQDHLPKSTSQGKDAAPTQANVPSPQETAQATGPVLETAAPQLESNPRDMSEEEYQSYQERRDRPRAEEGYKPPHVD